ncbi:MAG: DUF3108 domain-containing protein [Verrucomicrobia bacterium]|nr:DUF3108 domain-containing protein [Verrucomicrobiota bacterium]
MRIAATISAALLAATTFAGTWRDQLSPPQPGPFPPPRPLHICYKFGWGLIPAGAAEADMALTDAGLLRVVAKGGTTGAVRALWRLDAEGTSLCRPATLRPVSGTQREVYSNETVEAKFEFDGEGVTRTRQKKSVAGVKTKRVLTPNLFNMPTAFLWVRSQRLQTGDTYRCAVYPQSSVYLAEARVIGREKCEAAKKSYDAIKLGLRVHVMNRELQMEPHKKFKQAFAWFSDDSDRILLKMTADVFVGSVWMEMDKVEFPSSAE